ncbi:3'-5' exoribonuclease [Bryocella elongata]|uniref:3'-5' exoribonuclease n=1 Tax=Bryocella elongata TaxID=863522 RepID=A0A1H5ZBC0_9BACT|nr:OB-fold nucleic acid binding domain-containing protein [Bryocella elongata]SEG33592.1 3'-5' exoribonuclease [Bryocella elongata]
MKSFYIADSATFENQTVITYFVVAAVNVREKTSGGQYLAFTLADKSGQFEARMWDNIAKAVETCKAGCYVKAEGIVNAYNGKFQLKVNRIRAAEESEIDPADFVPSSQYNPEEMEAELRSYVDAFAEPHLRALVYAFLDDPEIGPAFRDAPAAKKLHHAWLHGLLEHVLYLVRVLRAVAPFYPEVNLDLVTTGAILHDVGKVRELSWRSTFEYTLEGQLIGHISIAQGMLTEKILDLDAKARASAAESGTEPDLFPPKLRVLLEHMILAHHGKLEFGSPKLPMTPEAMLLSAFDDLEAKFQTLRNAFAEQKAAGKPSGETTEWIRSMDRPLFDSHRWLSEREAETQDAD